MIAFTVIMLGISFAIAPFVLTTEDEDIHLYEGISLLSLSALIIAVHFILKDQTLIRVLDVLESVNLFLFAMFLRMLKRNKVMYLTLSLAAVTILAAVI
jgi:hypothetical protein